MKCKYTKKKTVFVICLTVSPEDSPWMKRAVVVSSRGNYDHMYALYTHWKISLLHIATHLRNVNRQATLNVFIDKIRNLWCIIRTLLIKLRKLKRSRYSREVKFWL